MILKPIGTIQTSYKKREGIRVKAGFPPEVCEIEILPEYSMGLKDIEQ